MAKKLKFFQEALDGSNIWEVDSCKKFATVIASCPVQASLSDILTCKKYFCVVKSGAESNKKTPFSPDSKSLSGRAERSYAVARVSGD